MRLVLLAFPGERERVCERRRGDGVNFPLGAASWHRQADAEACRAKDDGGSRRGAGARD